MKATIIFVISVVLFGISETHADSRTEKEVEQAVIDINSYALAHKKTNPGIISKYGALAFWSSGGLLQEIPPGGGPVEEFEVYTIVPKHIRVVTLVGGQAAIAHYYLEGSEQYKGQPAATNYLTRATQAFVKEDGSWKVRSTHWSRILGGVGTTKTAVPD